MFSHPSGVTLAISSIWGISNYFPNILDAPDAMEGVRNRKIFLYLLLLLYNCIVLCERVALNQLMT